MSDASSAAGQGRLAAVIASRGGQAAPRDALIGSRDRFHCSPPRTARGPKPGCLIGALRPYLTLAICAVLAVFYGLPTTTSDLRATRTREAAAAGGRS